MQTRGWPFKDTAGPSMNILIKLMSLVSLAPWLLTLPINRLAASRWSRRTSKRRCGP